MILYSCVPTIDNGLEKIWKDYLFPSRGIDSSLDQRSSFGEYF